MAKKHTDQDRRFEEAAAFAPAINRLARGYEADPDRQRDLVQDIHLALWRSFARFDDRCSLRTWVYRIAHNTGASHILKERRARTGKWISLDHAEELPGDHDIEAGLQHKQMQARLLELIQRLEPPDRQIILLYLDGLDAAAIGEISGLRPAHIATKIQRLKALLGRHHNQGAAK